MNETVPESTRGSRRAAAALVAALLSSTAAWATPPIRTNAANQVPVCVSPDRLMRFVQDRNGTLDPKYRDLARWYKYWGEAWRVRWDYAFFQMVLETNYLKFRRGDGSRGDVHEKQNNFAGIGATGGGVAGERFPDIKTGVHAQIQHLVAYSGEHVAQPLARRTQENQDDIIAISARLRRPVTFADLARRWAADRSYARSIDTVAGLFRDGYCKGPATADAEGTRPMPDAKAVRRFPPPSGLGGPKQNLAGPETLPWAGETPPVIKNAEQDDPPAAAKPNAQKPAAPVRTLWTRQNGYAVTPGADGQPRTGEPQRDAPPEGLQAAVPAPPQPVVPKGVSEQAAPPGQIAPAVTQDAADAAPVELPTFRIAPKTNEPSHLGGPVPQPAASSTVAVPRGDSGVPGLLLETTPEDAASSVPPPSPRPVQAAQPAPRDAGARGACRVLTASYGGRKTLLVRSAQGDVTRYTALTVLDGFEQSMLATYAKSVAEPGEVVGAYASREEALGQARKLCPSG